MLFHSTWGYKTFKWFLMFSVVDCITSHSAVSDVRRLRQRVPTHFDVPGVAITAMANPGGDFSMAALVAPLPVNIASMVLDIVRIVPHALAGKALQACAAAQHRVELPDQIAGNIVWKIQQHLPAVCLNAVHAQGQGLPAALKTLREMCPGLPLVQNSVFQKRSSRV